MTKINAAIHTYTGRTLLLYNDMYYGEIDECTFTIKKHAYVKDRFVGLPEAVDSAFRYIDGKIYFFKGARVYAVSYTHLDVYKRQKAYCTAFVFTGRELLHG